MKHEILLFALCFSLLEMNAQSRIHLDEKVISADKSEDKRSEVANSIEIIQEKDIINSQISTTADLLEKKGNVFIQRSQLGGGSPIIRGFEGSRISIIIDGVRMNHAIYRTDHIQNVISIDNNMLEKVEILEGPQSTIYGSDALGGAMVFNTRKPKFSTEPDEKLHLRVGAALQYASAAQNRKMNLFLNLGGRKIASTTNFTISEFDHLRTGQNRAAREGDWGLNKRYVTWKNNQDTILANDKPWVIQNAAFRQYDLMQKISFKLSNATLIHANFQLSNTSDIPRTDLMNRVDSNGVFEYAEWRYGPQKRIMGSIQAIISSHTFLSDKLTITGAFQKLYEERLTRKFGNSKLVDQFENVSVASLNIDAKKRFDSQNSLLYGLEFIYNEVYSKATRVDKITGKLDSNATTLYPENGSYTRSLAAYIKHDYRFNDMWVFSSGMRFGLNSLNAGYQALANSIPFTELSMDNFSLVGHVSINFHPCNRYRFYGLLSSGFRAPNIADIGKFSSDAINQKLIIPNASLSPEKIYNFELGFYYSPTGQWEFDINPYFMYVQDLMQISHGQYLGADSILADGVAQKVYLMSNKNAGINTGIQFKANYKISKVVNAYANYTYTFGQNITQGLRLDHIPPMYGVIGVNAEFTKWMINTNIRFNGAKSLEFYGPAGSSDNIDYALPTGTPGWWTLNASAKYQWTKAFQMNFGIDNLFDLHYRPFSSGISAPGINFIVGMRGEF